MKSRWIAYGIAVGLVAATFAVNFLIPELTEQTSAVLFLAAVAVSSWCGGLGPGLLATTLSVILLDYFFIPEIHALDLGPAVAVSLGVFVLVAVMMSWLHALRRQLEAVLRLQNQRKAQFMAVLAHELRNFLAPIPASVAALKIRGQGDDAIEQTCAIIDRQVRSMTGLINDLLDTVRINEGKVRLCRESTDLGLIVSQAVDATRDMMDHRGHRLEVTLPSRPLPIQADRTRLQQVFVNLLTNAAKYTEPGGSIRLTVECTDDACLVRVRDNGRGLSPEMLPVIFELFMQAESGAHGGLGIGLNLVRGLVEMHGGGVTASSPGPGQGSEFCVRLPVKVEGHNEGTVIAQTTSF